MPHRLPAPFLDRDEVLAIARAGAAQGCKEALFTLGDRRRSAGPSRGSGSRSAATAPLWTICGPRAIAVLEETGLLPHLNPGVLTWDELQRLRPVAPSMGMMLETTADRLWSTPGEPHYGSPDKEPAVRLRVLADAGRVSIPFTTGILIGIGETPAERAESLHAIRQVGREYGHLQEVIVQNFRAKPDTAMRSTPDASSTTWPPPSPWPDWCSARRPASRRRRTCCAPTVTPARRRSVCCCGPASTTGAGCRR